MLKVQVVLVVILIFVKFVFDLIYLYAGRNLSLIHMNLLLFVNQYVILLIKRTVNCMIVMRYKNYKYLSLLISYLSEYLSGKE